MLAFPIPPPPSTIYDLTMDQWETYFRTAISESGASRNFIGFDAGMDHTYLGHLMANEQEATLSASGSTGGSHRGSSYEDED